MQLLLAGSPCAGPILSDVCTFVAQTQMCVIHKRKRKKADVLCVPPDPPPGFGKYACVTAQKAKRLVDIAVQTLLLLVPSKVVLPVKTQTHAETQKRNCQVAGPLLFSRQRRSTRYPRRIVRSLRWFSIFGMLSGGGGGNQTIGG